MIEGETAVAMFGTDENDQCMILSVSDPVYFRDDRHALLLLNTKRALLLEP